MEKELDVLTVYSRLFFRDIVAMVCLLQSGDHLSYGEHIACVGRAVLWNAVAVHLRSLRQEKGGSSRFPNFPSPHAVYCSNACSATQVMHNMGRVQFYRGVCQGGREAGKIFFCSKRLWLCTLRSVDLRDTSGLSHARWASFGVNTDTITTPSVGGQKHQQQNNSQHQLVTRWV